MVRSTLPQSLHLGDPSGKFQCCSDDVFLIWEPTQTAIFSCISLSYLNFWYKNNANGWIQIEFCTQNRWQFSRTWAPHEPKFVKNRKVPKSHKMTSGVFWNMFLIVFWCKWCAALSSVVRHGGPEGQKIRFNANVVWATVLGLVVSCRTLNCKNWLLRRSHEIVRLKIDALKLKFAHKTFDKFPGLGPLMNRIWQNWKF